MESSDTDSNSEIFSSQSQPMFSTNNSPTPTQPLLDYKCQTPMTEREKELDDQFEVGLNE